MGLHIAADVLDGDEFWDLVVECKFNFALVFTHFGRDPLHVELCEYFFFGGACQAFVRGFIKESVFVEFPSVGSGEFPESDVVVFGSGEVHECGAPLVGLDQSEVHLSAVVADENAGFGFAGGEDFFYVGKLCECLDDGGVVLGAGTDQKVNIADGFFAPAQAAGISAFLDQCTDAVLEGLEECAC